MMSLQEIKSSGTTAFLSPDVISTHPIYTSDRQDIRHQTGNSFCVFSQLSVVSMFVYWILWVHFPTEFAKNPSYKCLYSCIYTLKFN